MGALPHGRERLITWCNCTSFKGTPKAFDDFKNKQQKCLKWCFLYVNVCIFWKWIQCSIHLDKTQMLKQLFSIKINGIKNTLFFLSGAPTHDSFTFNLRFLYVLKHKCWIFHFGFRFVFIKVYILLNKVHRLLYFKSSLFFQN